MFNRPVNKRATGHISRQHLLGHRWLTFYLVDFVLGGPNGGIDGWNRRWCARRIAGGAEGRGRKGGSLSSSFGGTKAIFFF